MRSKALGPRTPATKVLGVWEEDQFMDGREKKMIFSTRISVEARWLPACVCSRQKPKLLLMPCFFQLRESILAPPSSGNETPPLTGGGLPDPPDPPWTPGLPAPGDREMAPLFPGDFLKGNPLMIPKKNPNQRFCHYAMAVPRGHAKSKLKQSYSKAKAKLKQSYSKATAKLQQS